MITRFLHFGRLALLGVLLLACRQDNVVPTQRTVERADESAAFPQDRVQRLDIKISPAQWKAMQEDATALLGARGTDSRPRRMGSGPLASNVVAPVVVVRVVRVVQVVRVDSVMPRR